MRSFHIKHGLDHGAAPTTGLPRSMVEEVSQVAVRGWDFPSARLIALVDEGQRVAIGAPLLHDRAHPQITLCSPAEGTVRAIHRGSRRRIQAVVLEVESPTIAIRSSVPATSAADPAELRSLLLASGLWTALRARPFEHVPAPQDTCGALFVTAMDSHPGAPDPAAYVQRHNEAFAAGLSALCTLAPQVWLCQAPGASLPHPDIANLMPVSFAGPHPAGLVGTHIHFLATPNDQIWHIGYQDVVAVGQLLLQGYWEATREVSLTPLPGASADAPAQLLTLRCGANLRQLNLVGESAEIASGSPLEPLADELGRRYLGRFHNQLWTRPARQDVAAPWWRRLLRPPAAMPVLSPSGQDTAPGATAPGMLTVEAFDSVWPLRTPAAALLRALLSEDEQTAAALGAPMLSAEDLALAACVCPVGLDYGRALLRTQQAIQRQG